MITIIIIITEIDKTQIKAKIVLVIIIIFIMKTEIIILQTDIMKLLKTVIIKEKIMTDNSKGLIY